MYATTFGYTGRMTQKLSPQHLDAWRLFLISHTRLVNKIDKHLQDADLMPLNWYDVLIELYEATDRKLRMSELAERVLLTRSGLTRLVDRLEKVGYLIREIDPDDRRGFYAIITEQGIEAMREAWKIYSASIQELFATQISDDEAQLLADIFTRMLDKAGYNA